MITDERFSKLTEMNKQTTFTKDDLRFIWDCCAEEKTLNPLTFVAIIDQSPLTKRQMRKGLEIAKKYGLMKNKFAGLPYDQQGFAGEPEKEVSYEIEHMPMIRTTKSTVAAPVRDKRWVEQVEKFIDKNHFVIGDNFRNWKLLEDWQSLKQSILEENVDE